MSAWTNIKRVTRYGFVGFIRNGFVSLAAVFIMIITLFTILWVLMIGAGFQSALHWLTEQVDITVYFEPGATPEQIGQVQKRLAALPEVASSALISREEALAQFKLRHANEQITMQALSELGDNPLGAAIEVRAKETSQYAGIAKNLADFQKSSSASGIDKVNYQQNEQAITQMTSFINALRVFGLTAGLILAAAALLISFNTIRLAIYTSRDEIGIMNLVGAGTWFVRGPFLVSGVLYGLCGGLVTLLLSYPLALTLGPGSEGFFPNFNIFTYYTSNFALLLLAVMGSGILLGAFSSYLAVRRYLKT